MSSFLLGANAVAAAIAGLFFLRFWRDTRDPFFLFFSLAFFIDTVNRLALAVDQYSEETEPFYYLVRLLSFSLILAGIAYKNRK